MEKAIIFEPSMSNARPSLSLYSAWSINSSRTLAGQHHGATCQYDTNICWEHPASRCGLAAGPELLHNVGLVMEMPTQDTNGCNGNAARAAPQWGHLNHGGRAGAELQPTAHWLFALALDRVWWTKTILCRSTCCFGQVIAPEEILSVLFLFMSISFGLGCTPGCASMLAGRAASHLWDGSLWSHCAFSSLIFLL